MILIVYILLICQVFAWDQETCKEFQCSDVWVFGKSCTYCCKDCCLITISNSDGCTKANCNNICAKTRGVDKDQCVIKYVDDSNGGQLVQSFGCESAFFCKDIPIDSGNDHKCVMKYDNGIPCGSSMECKSGMCTKFTNRPNVCYGCIPDSKDGSATRGKELTSHCNGEGEYCSLTDLTCTTKVVNGGDCQDNNYMCTTGKCDSDLNKCVECESNSDCDKHYNCEKNKCVFQKYENGRLCQLSEQCLSSDCKNNYC